jgi:acetylornithine/N-succinyldiaminopimelate aminotransferase
MANTQRILDRFNNYVIANHVRYPIVIESGNGCRLTDTDGKTYLDLFAGFGAGILGPLPSRAGRGGDEADVQGVARGQPAAHRAAEPSWPSRWRPRGSAAGAFFGHSRRGRERGGDEDWPGCTARRSAARASPRVRAVQGIISATLSLPRPIVSPRWGRPAAAAVREGFEPAAARVRGGAVQRACAAIEAALDDDTVAVIVEPIQGEGGVNVPDDDYLPKLARSCATSATCC